ncbi:hypothetical protein [Brevundimonas sp.]|uniref:hypothetical protein n=1 Tax=Brevundimonas sp. TaxID=1871086 RepID=UPI002E160EEF|nr:hypothetical protein [Brevundimonas sp.]
MTGQTQTPEPNLFERVVTLDMDKVMNLETLLQALLAAAVGALIVATFRGTIFLWRRFFGHERMHGRWHHHFMNMCDGKPVFRHEKIKIRPGIWLKKMVFVTDSPDRPNGHYSGEVIREKDFVLLYSKATDDDERILQRFLMPAVGATEIFVGLSCPQDYDGYASVHACILAKHKLTEEEFLRIANASIQVNAEYRIMTVKGIYGV